MDQDVPTETVRTAFALGCFWGPDALFGALDGVVRTCVGYAGGTTRAPTYEDIGDHIETVRLTYDPDQVGYGDLLDHFWAYHDPVRAPLKRQYQPALFPYTDTQVERTQASRADVAAEQEDALSTEIIEDASFTRAEPYHQKHKLRRHSPLLQAFQTMYPDDAALADSPAAALANGYVGGYRDPERLEEDAPRLKLPSEAIAELRAITQKRHG